MDWIGFLIRRTDPINFILWPTFCRRAAVRRPRPGPRRSFHCTYHHRTQKERAHNPGFRFRRIAEHRDPGGTTRRHKGVQGSDR